MSTNPPEHFVCQLTMEIFKDPVVDRNGISYERSAIMKWLETNATSPMTRAPLKADDLVPNRALKEAIEQFLQGATTTNIAAATNIANAAAATAANQNASHIQGPATSPELHVSVFENPRDNSEFLVTFTPPNAPNGGSRNRFPVDIVCCVDVSGSMGSDAPVQDAKGVKESNGLNILQVVGHAVRTVASLLGPNDRLSVVAYSNDASVVLPLTGMNDAGKTRVTTLVNALDPTGRTNMWAGIQKSVELLAAAQPTATNANSAPRLQSIFVLTDGVPTEHPPRGYVDTLKTVMKRTFANSRPITMHTFGFGYDLDSPLLDSLAELMCGSFTFIPDAGLIGTVFVNSIATMLSMAATSVKVVAAGPGVENAEQDESNVHHFGDVQFGVERTVWFRGDTRAKMVSVSFTSPRGRQVLEVPVQPTTAMSQLALEKVAIRRQFVDATRGSARRVAITQSVAEVTAFNNALKSQHLDGPCKALAKAMTEDIEGQVLLALGNAEFFKRWGTHYMLSLSRAHELAICNNFKDKSVQGYGGALFAEQREAGETVFLKIPAPQPSVPGAQRTVHATGRLSGVTATVARPGSVVSLPASAASSPIHSNRSSASRRAPSPVQMTSYYDYQGGCVAPLCQVLLADGTSTKLAKDIRKGDKLFGGAVVQCAVRIDKKNNNATAKSKLVVFSDGLIITKFHPVRMAGSSEWSFPVDCADVRLQECDVDELFTFLLEPSDNTNHSSYVVNGTEVIAWGHGITKDPTAAHEFFGSRDAIISALRGVDAEGFDKNGSVTIGRFVRDSVTLRITSVEAPMVA